MTKNNYISKYKRDNSRFGGIIYDGNFDVYHSLSDIAARIASDIRFDERCRKNIEMRKRNKERILHNE